MDIDEGTVLASEDDSESWQDEKGKFYFFLGGTSLFPSICPSFAHPISGTVYYLIIIFGTHV